MVLDISRIKGEPGARFSTSMQLCGSSLEQNPDVVETPVPLETLVKISNSDGLLVCHIEVELQVQLRCSRCLISYPFQGVVSFAEAFREDAKASEMSVEELYHGDINLFSGEEIDLGEVVRETLMAALPMKPVCEPQCLGLCASCGRKLYEGSCGCVREVVDPRWAVLAHLGEKVTEE